MQIIKSQSNIVEKVLRDKEGRLIRAKFFVYESAGRMKARLVDFTYIETLKGSVLSLSNFIKEKVAGVLNLFEKSFASPQFAFETIYVNGSKPRAPTFV